MISVISHTKFTCAKMFERQETKGILNDTINDTRLTIRADLETYLKEAGVIGVRIKFDTNLRPNLELD